MTEQSTLQRALGDRYTVHHQLGRGAMGSVYAATDHSINREVAIKVIRAAGEDIIERFKKEVKTLSRLNHPHIPFLMDFGRFEDIFYYITRLERGHSLKTLLADNGPLPIHDALDVACAVAQALDAAHRLGIVHRDLKPSNIMIPLQGDAPNFSGAKVLDFGVAGAVSRISGKTQAGRIMGTPHYMSPEQITGEGQTPASDVFSLGILLYEMIYGERPFAGENVVALMQQIISHEVDLPDVPSVSNGLRQFVQDCLNKDPKKRPDHPHRRLSELISEVQDGPAVSTMVTPPPVARAPEPSEPVAADPAPVPPMPDMAAGDDGDDATMNAALLKQAPAPSRSLMPSPSFSAIAYSPC